MKCLNNAVPSPCVTECPVTGQLFVGFLKRFSELSILEMAQEAASLTRLT